MNLCWSIWKNVVFTWYTLVPLNDNNISSFFCLQVIHQKYRISYDEIAHDLCPVRLCFQFLETHLMVILIARSLYYLHFFHLLQVLSVQQLYRICTLYWDDSYNTRSVSQEVPKKFLLQLETKISILFDLEPSNVDADQKFNLCCRWYQVCGHSWQRNPMMRTAIPSYWMMIPGKSLLWYTKKA